MRRCYEAYAAGDLAGSGSAYSEDTVWDVSRFRADDGVHHGLDELRRSVARWREIWSESSFELERVIDAGDRVVAVIVERGRGRASGATVTLRYGQLVRVRDGKIVETVVYSDPDEACAAAGLPPPAG